LDGWIEVKTESTPGLATHVRVENARLRGEKRSSEALKKNTI